MTVMIDNSIDVANYSVHVHEDDCMKMIVKKAHRTMYVID